MEGNLIVVGYLKYLIKAASKLPVNVDAFLIELFLPSYKSISVRIKHMIENFSFNVNKDHSLIISLKLKGEASPIAIDLKIKDLLDNHSIKVSDINFSREWLNLVVKNFTLEIVHVLDWEIKGEDILVPKKFVEILRKIV